MTFKDACAILDRRRLHLADEIKRTGVTTTFAVAQHDAIIYVLANILDREPVGALHPVRLKDACRWLSVREQFLMYRVKRQPDKDLSYDKAEASAIRLCLGKVRFPPSHEPTEDRPLNVRFRGVR